MRFFRIIRALHPLLLLAIVAICQPMHVEASNLKGQGVSSPKKAVSLRVLLQRLQKHHPLLVAARLKLRGLKGVAKVSGAWPNLKLNYQREQLFPAVGQDLVGVQVVIPLGGRTFRKKGVAKVLFKLQEAYLKWLSFQLRRRLVQVYFRQHRLRQKIVLAQKLLAEFRRLRSVLSARVGGGRVAAMELTRFDLEVEQQRHRIKRDQERVLADAQLLARWAKVSARNIGPGVALVPSQVRPASQSAKVSVHPYIRYLQVQIALRQSQIKFARSRAWPDVSLSLSYLRQQASVTGRSDGHGFVAGVTLPLPFFQRNQAGVKRAQLQLRLSRRRLQRKRRQLLLKIKQARQRVKQGYTRLQRYQKRVLKRLPELLKAAQVAFRGGASFAAFLSTYRSIGQYQQFGLTLQYEVRVRVLTLEGALGHVTIK